MMCPIENFGIKPKKVYMFQLTENGIPIDKFLRVPEGGQIYNTIKQSGFNFSDVTKLELNFK